MAIQHDPRLSKKTIRLHCGAFLVRTLRVEDANESWANWGSDPEAIETLNTSGRRLSKCDLVKYIRGFDQRTHLLTGIFDKANQMLVGIFRLDIDYQSNHGLVSLFIGEPSYRNTGVTTQIFIPNMDYGFNTLRLDVVVASVLLRNKALIRFMLKTGWKMDSTPRQVRSKSDGVTLEVRRLNITREDWVAWKKCDFAAQVARFPAISTLLKAARNQRNPSGNS
jgi:RimJ/RimL family protein N-acetyltransferase